MQHLQDLCLGDLLFVSRGLASVHDSSYILSSITCAQVGRLGSEHSFVEGADQRTEILEARGRLLELALEAAPEAAFSLEVALARAEEGKPSVGGFVDVEELVRIALEGQGLADGLKLYNS